MFTYENQGANTFLVFQLKNNEEIDSLGLGMLTNNKIKGVAPILFTQMNEEKFLKYNISAKVSLKQFFTGSVTKKRLLGVFSSICLAVLSSEEYMIDPSNFILDLEYIFTDVTTCEASLICLPVVQEQAGNFDISAFFKEIVFNTQFDQTENCDYVAKLINYLNSTQNFSLSSFKDLLVNLMNDKIQTSTAMQAAVSKPISCQPKVEVSQPKLQPVQQTMQKNVVQSVDLLQPQTPLLAKNSEKSMSMFTLLMHYSKENKALYKNQKQAMNEGKVEKKQNVKSPNYNKQTTMQQASFAIPGMPTPSINQTAQHQINAQTKPNMESQPIPQLKQQIQNSPIQAQISNQIIEQQNQHIATGNVSFGETTVLSAAKIGETTVLNAASATVQNQQAHLVRKKNSERIPVSKPVFRIGKEKSYVDYFISDNTAISRSHANILQKDGLYFLVDTNSTNHTYLDEKMIVSNEEKMISQGSKIRLANEEFIFNLY